ncbi:MAG: RNA polymerase factor sigma-32 [Sandaracinus sp.]
MAGKKKTKTESPARRDEDGEALSGEVVDESEAPREREPIEGDEPLEAEVVETEPAGPGEADLEGEIDFEADGSRKGAALAKRESGAISQSDPLQAYMRDVQRYSLLTPEETHDLAVKYVQTGDVEAAKKLVTSNLRLVVKIAFDYRRAYRNILDLVQEGNIGLMQAVKKYDPYRGVKLSSYAAWWIRAYILRFILNNWRLVKVGTTQAQRKLFFNLKKEKARLAAMGIEPTPELIAKNLDVPTEEVVHMDRRLSAGEVSLDAPVGQADGKPTSRLESMPSADTGADVALAEGELNELLSEKIHEFGRTLKGKDEIIFKERLMADEPKTLQELGDQFGVSRERVRQLEKRLQNKIKAYLEATVEKGALE